MIYGSDDRVDVYAEPDARWRERARASVIALIPEQSIEITAAGVELKPRSLQERYALCRGERFSLQPAAAECSGVLIDRDLVLSAGHCFDMAEPQPCQRYRYVYDYVLTEPNTAPVLDERTVYGCRRILAQRTTQRTMAGDYADFAVVQLDRPVSRERVPLSLADQRARPGDAVTVIGFPSGLPAKLDHGALVRSSPALAEENFAIDSDTFAASSGSAVLNAAGQLLGHVVSGAADYTYLADAGCQITRHEDLEEPDWEKVLGADYTARALCEAGWPNLEHCGRPTACGDGFCSDGEEQGCAADCGDPSTAVTYSGSDNAAGGCSVARPHAANESPPWQLLLALLALKRRRRRGHWARRSPAARVAAPQDPQTGDLRRRS